jgi:conjugative relaxase-like TrwC/TraI family protein
LTGEVDEARFRRLAEGQHPSTAEALVRHRPACRYHTTAGRVITVMAHRAGWDATFSAPKSVSLTALVGGDERVREAHQSALRAALHELEAFVEAQRSSMRESTGNWVAALFEHDSARPVQGYAAPQLHTHVLVFNLTQTADGRIRPLESWELFRSQSFATAVYRSDLAMRLREAGYSIEHGASGQPEIRGYTAAYLKASSPRRQQIETYLESHRQSGAPAAHIAAYRTREPKARSSREEMGRQHQALAETFGHEAARVTRAARDRAARSEHFMTGIPADLAVAYAESRAFAGHAVADERLLLRHALRLSMGEVSLQDLRTAFERRLTTGEFISVQRTRETPGRVFAPRETRMQDPATNARGRDGERTHLPAHDAAPRLRRAGQEQSLGLGR